MKKLIKLLNKANGLTAEELAEKLQEKFIIIDKPNTKETEGQPETKIDMLKQHLTKKGYISNVAVLNGEHGFRSSRLADMIYKLKHQGWVFDVRELRTSKNRLYKDCIYTVAINPTLK